LETLGNIGLFVRVADRQSFSSVARETGLSPSAISKAIARLEARLGVRLFNRTTRSLALTREGDRFLERCQRILSEVEAAELEMSDAASAPRGKLRVSLPRYSQAFEAPIADFMKQYPAVALDLDFTDDLVEVVGSGFDAAIRMGELTPSGLKHKRLAVFTRIVVASPQYLKKRGRPENPSDLDGHDCLHYRSPVSGRLEVWPLRDARSHTGYEVPTSLICNNLEMRLYLALRGQGIATLPDILVSDHLRNGALEVILSEYTRNLAEIWLVWPPGRERSPTVKAFIDFMTAHVVWRAQGGE
jgi:DNA-binding transcriptional LysR family regulator